MSSVRLGPAIDTTTPPCHARGSACIHISTVVHRLGICPPDAVSQPPLVENDGLVARRGRIGENSTLRRAPADVSAPSALAQPRRRPSASRGAYRDATKTSPLPEGFRPAPAPGPPSAEGRHAPDDPHQAGLRAAGAGRRGPLPRGATLGAGSPAGRSPPRRLAHGRGAERRPPSLVRPQPEEVDGGPIPLPSRAHGPSRRVAAAASRPHGAAP